MSDKLSKTTFPGLESNMQIQISEDSCLIIVGGCQSPEYNAEGETLIDAISELISMVAEDAINDEAIKWKELPK